MHRKSRLAELLQRAQNGDDAARNELFASCRNYVSVVAQAHTESWLQSKVDTSDLVQQTLFEAHRNFAGFRGQTDAQWLAWLRRILLNNAADYVRHYQQTAKRTIGHEVSLYARGTDDSDFGPTDPSAGGPSPSEIVVQREREIQVADGIARLSEEYRQVIMLRNLQRLTFEEIARHMGRSRPAVQMLWMRALRKLQQVLEQQALEDA